MAQKYSAKPDGVKYSKQKLQNPLKIAWITKTDSESDFIQSMKSKLLEEINEERLDNQHKFCQKYNF